MAAHAEREGASSAPSLPMCRQCGRRPRWTVRKRGSAPKAPELVVVSDYCEEHSHVALFKPPEPVEPEGRRDPSAAFRNEVKRQRLERERQQLARRRRPENAA
jgi:hypothetical protein